MNRARGLTLVELLTVIGIFGLLVGLLVPALSGVRTAAKRNAEVTAARQAMVAYQAYAVANKDRVMPGFKYDLYAVDPNGHQISEMLPAGSLAAARYPWRLAPYLDFNLRGLYLNEHQEMIERAEWEEDYEDYVYAVSLWPSLGLNTVFVGGDQNWFAWAQNGDQQDFFEANVWGRFYISSHAEAPKPHELIVFASARGSDSGDITSPVYQGYYQVTPPYFDADSGYRWHNEYHPNLPPGQYGFLSPRYGGEAIIAFMDGHVGGLDEEQLKDMRHWARDATDPDWGLVELP